MLYSIPLYCDDLIFRNDESKIRPGYNQEENSHHEKLLSGTVLGSSIDVLGKDGVISK